MTSYELLDFNDRKGELFLALVRGLSDHSRVFKVEVIATEMVVDWLGRNVLPTSSFLPV